MKPRLWLLTALALLAFAGNSVLNRWALAGGLIDAAGFTAIRLLAGAVMLTFLCLLKTNNRQRLCRRPTSSTLAGSLFLFVYALAFSVAYRVLDTGSGALILFAAVQLTLLMAGFIQGHRPAAGEWLGLVLAFVGLGYLLLPAWGSPTLAAGLLMMLSGIAWGGYTLLGRSSAQPLLDTSRNFLWSLPWVVLLCWWQFTPNAWSLTGVGLAVASGALTSGLGYAIWYAVLPHWNTLQAGVLQLLVPVLAAIGGVLFNHELVTWRLAIAAGLVLGGSYLVLRVGPAKT
ncbi:DMT family transporter [Marinicella meishanensis]|uniref:DMT family transporter n=1 Tax=Marinicella meishanensis TaxID=2873263 RepID=UPI001CC1BB02|nr:DMT family transporter [Marinicella sp. NBU2979]